MQELFNGERITRCYNRLKISILSTIDYSTDYQIVNPIFLINWDNFAVKEKPPIMTDYNWRFVRGQSLRKITLYVF